MSSPSLVPNSPQQGAPQLSVDEFASKIKAKYPEYQSLDNTTLAQKVIAKYPEYKDKVNFGSTSSPQNQSSSSAPLAPSVSISRPEGGLGEWFHDLGNDVRQGTGFTAPGRLLRFLGATGTEKGTTPTTASLVGGLASGPPLIGEGAAILPEHPIKGANKIIQGAGQTLALPAALNPATATVAVPGIVAQHFVQKGAEKLGVNPDVAELGGNIAGIVAGAKANNKVSGSSTTAGKLAPSPRQTSTSALVKATNPAAADLGRVNANGGGTGFKGNVDTIHDIHLDYAKKAGIPEKVAAAKTPGEALEIAAQGPRGAAESLPFFKQVMEPNLQETASTPNGYAGGTVDHNTATIQQLSDRLTAINGELYPKAQKGGAGSAASDAALNAERSQKLQAEAAGIRSAINNKLSEKTGIPVEKLEPLRAQYGQLKDVADTMQYRANEMQHAENTAGNKPLSEQVPSHLTATAAAAKVGAKVLDKVAGHPVINGLKKMYEYEPQAPQPLQVTPPGPPPIRIRDGLYDYIQPTHGKPGTQSPLPPELQSALEPNKGDIYAQQQKLAARQREIAQSKIAQTSQQNKNLSSHGRNLSEANPGGGPPPEIPLPQQSSSSPAIPAAEPGLLRPGTGKASASSPLRFGPQAAHAPIGEVTGRQMTVGQEHPEITGHSSLPPEIEAILNGGQPKQLPPARSIQLGPSTLKPTPKVPEGRGNPSGVPEHLTPQIDRNMYQTFRKSQQTPVTQKPDGSLQFHGTPETSDYQMAIEKFGNLGGVSNGSVELIENSSGTHGFMPLSRAVESLQSGEYRLAPRSKAARR